MYDYDSICDSLHDTSKYNYINKIKSISSFKSPVVAHFKKFKDFLNGKLV